MWKYWIIWTKRLLQIELQHQIIRLEVEFEDGEKEQGHFALYLFHWKGQTIIYNFKIYWNDTMKDSIKIIKTKTLFNTYVLNVKKSV